ncbi:MAG: hypothetical protein OEM40_05100, partial [Acidimicrobiia bacterium]|nr:hypothetical protein [Acidimicrobiia bacterium]
RDSDPDQVSTQRVHFTGHRPQLGQLRPSEIAKVKDVEGHDHRLVWYSSDGPIKRLPEVKIGRPIADVQRSRFGGGEPHIVHLQIIRGAWSRRRLARARDLAEEYV